MSSPHSSVSSPPVELRTPTNPRVRVRSGSFPSTSLLFCPCPRPCLNTAAATSLCLPMLLPCSKVKGAWGRRLLAVAGEVTRHGRAHPYSWSISIVSESEECHRSEWKTKLLSVFLAVTCQHASGTCQSHSRPVLNLREASQKYVELSPSTPPFLTLRLYEKDLTLTPNLLRISGQYSLRLSIFDTPSAWAYLFSPLKVIRVTGSVG